MKEPQSERPARRLRPKRRGLEEFAPSEEGRVVEPPTVVHALVPIQPIDAGSRDENPQKGTAKIRRVKIAPELLNGDKAVGAGGLQHAREIDSNKETNGNELPSIESVVVVPIASIVGRSDVPEQRQDALLAKIDPNVHTGTSAIAQYNQRTVKLIIDSAFAVFELTQSLARARGPFEVARLTTNHLQTLSDLMIRHTMGIGTIAKRSPTKPHA
jgi:hypothetical protein